MAYGGSRPGAGRKKGGMNAVSRQAREMAAATGELPHEFMLRIMRDKNETKERRLDAAKAAAPFYAPRLAAVMAKVNQPGDSWDEIFKLIGPSRGLPAKKAG